MTYELHELIRFRADKLFNGAVSIDWFGEDPKRARLAAEAFVFHGPRYHGVSQEDVGIEHGHRLLDTASFALSIVRRSYGIEDQPFTLAIAGYGTGKSHLGLALACLLSEPEGEVAQNVLASIQAADSAVGAEVRAILQEARKPCLVVALNGMKSFDLTTELTRQVIRQLKSRHLDTRALDELRPRFSQAATLVRMANEEIKAEVVAICNTNDTEEVIAALARQDELIYNLVHGVFAAKGMALTALRGESVRDIVDTSIDEYCGTDKPFQSLVILFDEFGRYTEFATMRSQIAGSGVLQDLFEGIQASNNAASFSGFIQFELNAYVQRIAAEYKNEILRYVTRYQTANRVYLSINLETLIANLLEKAEPGKLEYWFARPETKRESEMILHDIGGWFPQSRNHRLWTDVSDFHSIIRIGCWPLSPYSTWFLFHLAAAGKHLQERSALAILGQALDRLRDSPIPDGGGWSIAPVDFWSDDLQQELIGSEESGQQGAITLAYSSVEAKHGSSLSSDLLRILRAVVLASKLGLHAGDRNDAVKALSRLSGLANGKTASALELLEEEYNVVEWEEAFKQFDILGDAIPRTQFLSFVRRRAASSYDNRAKATLFASRAAAWCDLLGNLECDFAEDNRITTREWRFQAVTSSLETFAMHVKLASDRWEQALQVDEPRGTVIYCYVEPDRDPSLVANDVSRILRTASKEKRVRALPILTVLICDEDGTIGDVLAELAVLDEESLTEDDKVKFGNLIPAHKQKQLQVLRSQVDTLIKQRKYVTSFKEPLTCRRLDRAGTELFSRIYDNPLTFPFDGFSTARGNAADSCQELTRELLLGALDYDAVIGKPTKIKNRAVTVLKEKWGIFSKNGTVMTRPSYRVLRGITTKWDEMLASGERRLPLEKCLRDLCSPPFGANVASAGLVLGVFVAPRHEKLVVVRDEKQFAVSQWVQDGIFRGKFLDLSALNNIDLIMMGEESSEWETLLDEWEQAESYFGKVECLKRALTIKDRIPVPPALGYREVHMEDAAKNAAKTILEMEEKQNDALNKIESGHERKNVSLIAWGAATLCGLIKQMDEERPRWEDQEIQALQPHVTRAKQDILQLFPEWLRYQVPRGDAPDAVGDFKHKMLRLFAGSLKTLELNNLVHELENHVAKVIRNAETAAEARQLVRDVRSWLLAHRDVFRTARVAEVRGLLDVGKEYASKLQGMSRRIQLEELAEVRTNLSQFQTQLKEAVERTVKRAEHLWKIRLCTVEDLDGCLEEIESLVPAFEGCTNDLTDLHMMRQALRTYQEDYKQLADERLTWPQFDGLAHKLQDEAEQTIKEDDVPWLPSEVIQQFVEEIAKHRKEASSAWIDTIEADASGVSSFLAPDANRLHARACSPPAVLTEAHVKRLENVVAKVEARLDSLKIEWLLEKFKELSPLLRRKFIQMIELENS